MSSARIERLLRKSVSNVIPVPRLAVKDIKEDALSKKLRQFDNSTIAAPYSPNTGIYINTNERGVIDTSSALDKIPRITKSCHIGFSGWHNFDIMAQRCSDRGIICDLNPENALFLYFVLFYVRTCTNRFDFIERINQFIKENSYAGARINTNENTWQGGINPFIIKFCLNVSSEPPYSEHYTINEEVDLELQRTTSWLYTDARYAHIRTLALEDKIALITESICAFETFANITRLLKDNMIQIDTVYVSNIYEWMDTPEDRRFFSQTLLSLLTDKETILIDSKHRSSDIEMPTQRLTTADKLNSSNIEHWFYGQTLTEAKKGVPPDNQVPKALQLSM